MKRQTGFAFVVAGASIWLCFSTLAAPQVQDNSPANTLQELLKQRRDVLKSRFEIVEAEFKINGHAFLDEHVSAHNQLLMAEFELASEKQQRLALLRQRIDNLRSLERVAGASVRTAQGSKGEELLAIANRIQAEIDYVREDSKSD